MATTPYAVVRGEKEEQNTMPNINWPYLVTGQQMRTINLPYTYAISEDMLVGYDHYHVSGEKLGISKDNYEVLDSGFSSEPTTPTGAREVSSSANDTIAGTGAQKVLCTYLDEDWIVKTETVSLNGTTPVSLTATDIMHIQGFEVIQAGSALYAAGNIDWQNPAGTVTYARVLANTNVWQIARMHVPANTEAYITQWTVSAYNGAAKFILETQQNYSVLGGGTVYQTHLLMQMERGSTNLPLILPEPVMEKKHIRVRGQGKSAGVDVSTILCIYLVAI